MPASPKKVAAAADEANPFVLPGEGRGYPAPAKAHVPVARKFRNAEEELSPRLMPPDDSMVVGAPMLPELEEHFPEERFCMDGPVIAVAGMPARRSAAVTVTVLSFPQLVARMESSVGQATLLLNDRLRTLHLRAQKMAFSESHTEELCLIADGVAAASYHLQKWQVLLAPEEGQRKPTKPGHCEDTDEAFAVMHCASPRILVAAAGASKGLTNAIKNDGEKAEANVNLKGVPTEDIRALGPHLEALIFRLSRLSGRMRDPKKNPDIVETMLAPVIGSKPAEMMPEYLERSEALKI